MWTRLGSASFPLPCAAGQGHIYAHKHRRVELMLAHTSSKDDLRRIKCDISIKQANVSSVQETGCSRIPVEEDYSCDYEMIRRVFPLQHK